MRVVASLYLPSIEQMIKDCGLDEGGEIQKTIDQFVLEQSEPYIPMDDARQLILSGTDATKIGSGEVIWDTPYANYLYEGKLMVDPITLKGAFYSPDYGFWSRPNTAKIMDPSGRDLIYHGGDNRRDHWFDRMMIDKKEELIEECQKVINRRLG